MKDAIMDAPIYKALKNYIGEVKIPFHMPGHKMGKFLPEAWSSIMNKIDVTEVPGLDNLHFPTGAIKEAQELAAVAFGAYKTYFLVNGSSVGIHAAIMSICNKGDKIIVARDCHRAVIGGVILAGADPIYVPVEVNDDYGIPSFVSTDALIETLKANMDARAVLITRPNYYGICSDINKIVDITHSFGKVLIVDEAHGAHFKFHDSLPVTSLSAGADICIQSAHKTLPALTQSAYLHLNSDLVDINRVEQNLRLLQTTSPSYILMSSLDIARAIMEHYGNELLEKLIDNIDCFNTYISELNGIKILEEKDLVKKNAGTDEEYIADSKHIILDKTRIVINFRNINETGYGIQEYLRNKFSIQVEMADMFNIVCIATVADEKRDFNELLKGLSHLVRERCNLDNNNAELFLNGSVKEMLSFNSVPIPEQGVKPCEILNYGSKQVLLKNSVGRICRDFIVPYPPGIPLICPGEIISLEIIDYIHKVVGAGGIINGIIDHGDALKVNVIG